MSLVSFKTCILLCLEIEDTSVKQQKSTDLISVFNVLPSYHGGSSRFIGFFFSVVEAARNCTGLLFCFEDYMTFVPS